MPGCCLFRRRKSREPICPWTSSKWTPGGEVGATARLEFSLKDTFRESYLEYCLAVSKQGEKDILTYDNHDKNDTVELTLQRGLCYSLYVLISRRASSRAFSGCSDPWRTAP